MGKSETKSNVIVVANRPRIFRELLHLALTTALERFTVFEVSAETELGKALKVISADWVIVTCADDHSLPSQAQAALNAQPALSAIAVSPDGSQVEVMASGTGGRSRRVHHNISLAELVSVLSQTPQPVAS
jgi:hypothetical protein